MNLTWLEINKKAIEFNLQQFRKLAGDKVFIMPVIKANAYGHGFFEIAKICDENKHVDKICVVNLEEASALINRGLTKKQIIILSFFENDEKKIEQAIKNKVVFPIYDIKYLKILDKIAKKIGKQAIAHIKIDTGASRVGFLENNIKDVLNKIKKTQNIKIEGIFSHFASSETDKEYTDKQIKKFNKIVDIISEEIGEIKIKHISCSSAATLYKKAHYNAIRIGLSAYGLYPNERTKNIIKLKPALKWVTRVIQTKAIPPLTSVGYGRTFVAKKAMSISILPVGYWDGYDRSFSNNSQVLIRGKKCPVIGRICMNMMIVDTTGTNAKIGDSAVLIGKQGANEITADELAKRINTINYEIVDRINPLLARIVK